MVDSDQGDGESSCGRSTLRSERYTLDELVFIFNAIKSFPNIIESPKSHTETKNRKTRVWNHIAECLRKNFPQCTPKSPVQLRNWWKRTKSRAKQKLANKSICSFEATISDSKPSHSCTGRGYLELIYTEICEFCQKMETDYNSDIESEEYDMLISKCENENSCFIQMNRVKTPPAQLCNCNPVDESCSVPQISRNPILLSLLLNNFLKNKVLPLGVTEKRQNTTHDLLKDNDESEQDIKTEILLLKKRKLLLELDLVERQLYAHSKKLNDHSDFRM